MFIIYIYQAYYLNINVTGKYGYGASIIVDPDGRVMHQAGEKQAFMPVHIDLYQVTRSREKGMMGLGQTLKSFRDSQVSFTAYQSQHDSQSLQQLGALTRASQAKPADK